MEKAAIMKRAVKDSVFSALFSEQEYLEQLCRILRPEVTDEELKQLELVTIRNVIVTDLYNDLAFTVGELMIFLIEAQSTWTVNILIRFVLYYAKELQRLISKKDLNVYAGKKLTIPKPIFYVVYTGSEPHNEEYISLADEFFGGDAFGLELKVKIIHQSENDNILDQYIKFTKVSDEQVKLKGRSRETAAEIIDICVENNILKDFLSSRKKEVIDMLDILFDQEYVVDAAISEAKREGEARGEAIGEARGQAKGIINLMKNLKMTAEQAMEALSIPREDYEKYKKLLAGGAETI